MKKVKIRSILLAFIVLFSSLISFNTDSNMVYAQNFTDMPNNWAKGGLQYAIGHGLLKGHDNKIRPNDSLTRAQLATVTSRILALKEQADLSDYKDISSEKWYYQDFAKAVEAGIFQGYNNNLYPEKNITREETFAVMSRVFALKTGNEASLRKFADSQEISSWAKADLASLVDLGYVNGDNQARLNPKQSITRAEFAKFISNITSDFIQSPQDIENKNIAGNLVVNSKNVTLNNVKIQGDLILAEGLGQSKMTLDKCQVEGRILVRGGKVLDLKESDIKIVEVLDKTNNYNISLSKNTKLESIYTSSKIYVLGQGEIGDIYFKPGSTGSKVEVDKVNVNLDGAEYILDKLGKLVEEDTCINYKKQTKPNTSDQSYIVVPAEKTRAEKAVEEFEISTGRLLKALEDNETSVESFSLLLEENMTLAEKAIELTNLEDDNQYLVDRLVTSKNKLASISETIVSLFEKSVEEILSELEDENIGVEEFKSHLSRNKNLAEMAVKILDLNKDQDLIERLVKAKSKLENIK